MGFENLRVELFERQSASLEHARTYARHVAKLVCGRDNDVVGAGALRGGPSNQFVTGFASGGGTSASACLRSQ